MMQRLSAWAIAHPRVADALVALFFVNIMIAVGYSLRGTESEVGAPWQWAMLVLPAVALLWRRSAPIAAIANGTESQMQTRENQTPQVPDVLSSRLERAFFTPG